MTASCCAGVVILTICVLLILYPPYFWIKEYVNSVKWQKNSPVVNLNKEYQLGKITFVLTEHLYYTPISETPYAAVYKPITPLTEEEEELLKDGLNSYFTSFGRFFENLPQLGLLYTNAKIKNDWFYYGGGALVIINDANFRLKRKEEKKLHQQQLKEFWNK